MVSLWCNTYHPYRIKGVRNETQRRNCISTVYGSDQIGVIQIPASTTAGEAKSAILLTPPPSVVMRLRI